MSHKKSLIFALTLLLLLLPFVCCGIRLNQTLPNNLAVAKGSECKIRIGALVSTEAMQNDGKCAAGADDGAFAKEENGNLTLFTQTAGKYDVELKFLGVLPIKTMSVDVLENDVVIPGGDAIGIKIRTDGVLLVKLSSVTTDSGENRTPAKDANLQVGDIITKIDGIKVEDSDHFSALVDEKQAESFEIEFVRDSQTMTARMNSAYGDGHYKIGAWIRDSTAGIGTLTFIKPDTGVFASLGHGISDVDTGSLLSVGRGSITDCYISSAEHGQKGTPGELHGIFANNDIGIIEQNSHVGVYGRMNQAEFERTPVKIGARFEVKPGAAKILSTVEKDTPQEFDIEIEKVMTNSSDAKGMIIKVTDERLLEKTGGIVQGMSGSPILQNGKIVGAVTHVLINDPTRGYGIFIELMMDKAQQVGAGG